MAPINYNFNNFGYSYNPFMTSFRQDVLSAVSTANMTGSFGQFGSLTSGFNFQMPAMPAMPIMPAFNFNFSNLFASTFTPRRNTPQIGLTGRRAMDAVRLAESQIGVRENGSSNNSADVNKYRNGVQNGTPWCASFVSWCYGQGQGNSNASTFGYDASSQNIRRKAEKAGYYQKAKSGYTPKVGDVVVWNNGDGTGHVGIVSSINNDGTFQTIEGNCSNAVRRMTRRQSEVDGFVQMNEWIAANETGSRTSTLA